MTLARDASCGRWQHALAFDNQQCHGGSLSPPVENQSSTHFIVPATAHFKRLFGVPLKTLLGFPGASEVKASACSVGDLGLIPGSGRSPGEGNGNPLQYSCLENPMDRGVWWATVQGVAKSQSDFTSLKDSLDGMG